MLGLRFNLTPAQTEMLLVISNECYRAMDAGETTPCPDWESSYFVTTGRALASKGLVVHQYPSDGPSWRPTEAGKAMAKLIESHCERMLSYRERQKTVRIEETGETVELQKTAQAEGANDGQ